MRPLIFTLLTVFAWQALADLVIYTDRPEDRVNEIGLRYEKMTGTKVTVLANGAELLLQRLELELQNPTMVSHPADVIFVKGLVYMGQLEEKGLLRPMAASPLLDQLVLPNLRDSKNLWTAVTFRARTLVYDASVDVSSIETYEDLADPKWAGTLCLASASSSYNETLVAQLIYQYGPEKAKAIAKGLVANQSIAPNAKDSVVIRSLDDGDCTLALINSYYLGQELSVNPSYAGRIKFLNQQDGGVFVDSSSAGVAANSGDPVESQKFVEFLLSEDIQKFLTGLEKTFPANKLLLPDTVVSSWGEFLVNPLKLSDFYPNVEKAQAIMLEAQWK